MRRHPEWLWILGMLAATAAGSGLAAADDVAAKKSPPATAAPSEEECRAFARSVAQAMASGDPTALHKLIDWDAIFQTMAVGLEMSASYREGVIQGLRKSIADPERGLSGRFVTNVKKGGSLTFLRTRQSRGRPVVLFRMILPDEQGGLNYYEFAPRRGPGGQVLASDIYVYLSGELISETLHRMLLPMVADQSRSFLDRLITGKRDYVHDYPDMGRAFGLMSQGKPAEALAIFKKMRPGTRKLKAVLLGRIGAAQRVGNDAEYAEAIEEYRKNYPDDPSLDLISIDAYIMRKDFDGALKAIDRLDQALGGDPYLDTLRSGLCESRGDKEAARRFARRAVEKDPTILKAHWARAGFAIEARDYKEVLEDLKEIDRRFKMVFGDLTKVPAYAGFVQSPEYREWLDYLKNKKPDPGNADNRPASKPEGPGTTKPGDNG